MILFHLGLPFPEKQNENEVYYKINKNKLFNYPGFNAPCPPNTVDVRIL